MGTFDTEKQRDRSARYERAGRSRLRLAVKRYLDTYEALAFMANGVSIRYVAVEEQTMGLSDMLPSEASLPLDGPGSMHDEEFTNEWPKTWALCTSPTSDDGKSRLVSTLVFFAECGQWKVKLSERNVKYDLWAGGDTMREALDTLESLLMKRPVPWRKATVFNPKK